MRVRVERSQRGFITRAGSPAVAIAASADPTASAAARGRRLRFLANVDPVDVWRSVDGLDPETTLVRNGAQQAGGRGG